jgi:hypothetical protein
MVAVVDGEVAILFVRPDRVERAHADASRPQAVEVGAGCAYRADGVVEHPNRDSATSSLLEQSGETFADCVSLQNIGLEFDGDGGRLDGREHGLVGMRAVHQQPRSVADQQRLFDVRFDEGKVARKQVIGRTGLQALHQSSRLARLKGALAVLGFRRSGSSGARRTFDFHRRGRGAAGQRQGGQRPEQQAGSMPKP